MSAIVGFSVPAATALADNLKPTKQNDEISGRLRHVLTVRDERRRASQDRRP